MKKILFFTTLIYLAVFGIAVFASAHSIDTPNTPPAHVVLGIPEPTVLPTSPLYFLKNIFRAARMFFTFDPVKKAELELHLADEKLAEAFKVADTAQSDATLEKALENYLEAHRRLEERLISLKDKNKNVDRLLESLADRVVKHTELFESFEDEFAPEARKEVEKAILKHIKHGLDLDKKKFKAELRALKAELELQEELAELARDLDEDIAEEFEKLSEELEEDEKEVTCIQLYDPVCGQDGKTYSNSCFAGLAKVDIAHQGECRSAPKSEAPSGTRVTIDANGNFSPASVSVKKDGKVTWTNRGERPVWPASALHPTHRLYPGFDALRGISFGEEYSFKFDRPGVWKYHDHFNPSKTGTIEVVE